MSYQPKDGSGALFKNDKGENPSRPDYRGDICINGEVYELAAWLKPLPSDASKRYMSLSAKPKQAHQAQQQRPQAPQQRQTAQPPQRAQRAPSSGFEDMDSDIPFIDPMKRRAFALSL